MKAVALTWVGLTTAILAVDYVGVQLADLNGLVFNVHVYWYGLSFLVAAVAFSFVIWIAKSRHFSAGTFMSGFSLAGVWWLFALCLLMVFHGAIGGWY